MTDSVNRVARAGSFLTGAPNWISIATLLDIKQTNVTTPVIDLPGYQTYATLGIWTTVTVVDGDGVAQPYTNINDYRTAFYQQKNLDIMVGFITERANPTQISVKTLPTSINGGTINAHTSVFFGEAGYGNLSGNATVFGTDYNDTGYNITIVDVATEHNLAWGSNGFSNYGSSNADNTNDMGYNLMTAINGNEGFDPQDWIDNFTDNNSPYTKLNDGAPLASYIDVATTTGCNTMVAIGKSLPGTLLA